MGTRCQTALLTLCPGGGYALPRPVCNARFCVGQTHYEPATSHSRQIHVGRERGLRYIGATFGGDRMKRPALALLACLLFASISFAQQNDANAAASKADVQRCLDVMHSRQMMKEMVEIMTVQMRKIIHERMQKQQNLPADAEARLDKSTDEMVKNFPVDEMLEAIIPVYQKHFTKGDMDALVAFYSSPTGEKMVKEMPAIMSESMQAATGVMQNMMAKMTQQIDDQIAQMQKADDGKSSKPSPSTPN